MILKVSLVALWFVISSIAVIFVGKTNMKDFDQSLLMSQALMDLEYEQNLVGLIKEQGIPNGSLIHITSKAFCFCDQLARGHQSSLDKKIQDSSVDSFSIQIDSKHPLSKLIPSTPAVVLIDKNGNLKFAGPYSEGTGCFGKYGQIDGILDNYLTNQHSNPIIRSEANGCYCNLS